MLLVGIALRSWQWLENYPLWIDELALANGLLRGSFAGLFDGPSDFAQIAPPGFLALEWLVSRAFPASDIALRLPSFVFSCAAIAATWSAARELVGERNAWVAAQTVRSGKRWTKLASVTLRSRFSSMLVVMNSNVYSAKLRSG